MIFFRADAGYQDGENLQAAVLDAEHEGIKLRSHVDYNGVSAEKGGDPYISLTEVIGVAALKYSYGRRNGASEFNFNKRRAKVLLIDLDDSNKMTDIDATPPKENAYFSFDTIKKAFPDMKGYAAADREAVVYREISASKIHEIHPFLVDVLVALDYCKGGKDASELYDGIVDGVRKGIYSVEKVEQMIQGLQMNNAERVFVDEFYGKRNNIEDSFNISIPSENKRETSSSLYQGTCLRTQVIKDLLPQFISQEFPDRNPMVAKDFILPLEKDIGMSAAEPSNNKYKLNGNIHVINLDEKHGYDRSIPYGMEFKYDDQGNVVGTICQYKELRREVMRDGKYDNPVLFSEVVKSEPEILSFAPGSAHYTSNDVMNNPQAKAEREAYINRNRAKARAIEDMPNEFWAFDEDGFCLRCREVTTGEEKRLEIIDFEKDAQGNRTMYDNEGRGYNEAGFDPTGHDREGLDEKGCDKSGANKSGIPSQLLARSEDDLPKILQDDIVKDLKEAMENFKQQKESELVFKKSPVERILTIAVNKALTSSQIMIIEKGRNKEEYRIGDERKSQEHFYNETIYELLDGVKKIEPDNPKSGTTVYNSKGFAEKVIKAAIEVGSEYGINVQDIVEQEMERITLENEAKVKEAQEVLANAKKEAKKLGYSVGTVTKEQKAAFNKANSEAEKANVRMQYGKKMFEDKFKDKSGDDR